MITVDINELSSNLTKFLEMAGRGEEITVISKSRAIATITSPEDKRNIAKQQLNELAATATLHNVGVPSDSHWDAKR